jgi:hypothetical protein
VAARPPAAHQPAAQHRLPPEHPGADARGDVCEVPVAAVQSDANGTADVQCVFSTGRLDGRIQLELQDDNGQTVWKHSIDCREGSLNRTSDSTPAICTQLLLHRHQPVPVLAVGPVAGLQEMATERSNTSGRQPVLLLSADQTQQLPSLVRGLDSLEVLVLASDFSITEQQLAAIRSWVLSGGHLVVSCGASAELLQSPLGQWLQPVFEIPSENSTYETLDLTAVQNFLLAHRTADQSQSRHLPPHALRQAPESWPRHSVNRLFASCSGAGVITLVAVDINARPMDKWLSLPQFLDILLFGRDEGAAERAQRGSRISSIGISDLSTQLAAATDAACHPSSAWSTWDAMLLIVVLLALIGPLDWFLVVRTLKSPRLTWATFPLIIGSACPADRCRCSTLGLTPTCPAVSACWMPPWITADSRCESARGPACPQQNPSTPPVSLPAAATLQALLPPNAET